MQEEKFYTINVFSHPPQKGVIGNLNKTTGLPSGKQVSVDLPVGQISIPNYSEVWGKLVKSGPKLTGEITYYPWGDPKGEIVRIRHLKSCTSLSMEYQAEKKLFLKEESTEAEILLRPGIQNFNSINHMMLIDMLKHHSFNVSNESRNPDTEGLFENYVGNQKSNDRDKNILVRREAEDYLLGIKGDGDRIMVLADIFDLVKQEQNDMLYDQLGVKLEEYGPEKFLAIIANKKLRMREDLEFAKDNEILYGTNEGEMTIRDKSTKVVPFLPGVIQDGEDQVGFLMENFMNPVFYEAITSLRQRVKEHKDLVLN